MAVFGVGGVLLHVDFRNCVHGRRVDALGADQLRDTVHQHVVARRGVAAHVQLAHGPVVVRRVLRPAAIVHCGIQRCQHVRVPIEQRQLLGELRVESGLHGGRRELDRDRSFLDSDSLGHRAEFQGRVDRDVGPRLDQDVLLPVGSEPLGFDGHRIRPRQDEVEQVLPCRGGLRRDLDVGVVIGQRDVRARYYRPARIRDRAHDLATQLLRRADVGADRDQCRNGDPGNIDPHGYPQPALTLSDSRRVQYIPCVPRASPSRLSKASRTSITNGSEWP